MKWAACMAIKIKLSNMDEIRTKAGSQLSDRQAVLVTYLGMECGNTVQCTTLQCSTIQCSAEQYCTVQYRTVQYTAVQYSTVKYTSVLYSTVQYSTLQYSAVRQTTVRYTTTHSYQEAVFFHFLPVRDIAHTAMLLVD